jgi:hypothetical protein
MRGIEPVPDALRDAAALAWVGDAWVDLLADDLDAMARGHTAHLRARGLDLDSRFLVAEGASARHPEGTIVVIGLHGWRPGDFTGAYDTYVVEFDVASGTESGRLLVGSSAWGILAQTSTGIAVGLATPTGLSVVRLLGTSAIASRLDLSVPPDPEWSLGLGGFGVVGDRIVFAGTDSGKILVFDAQGHLLGKPICYDDHWETGRLDVVGFGRYVAVLSHRPSGMVCAIDRTGTPRMHHVEYEAGGWPVSRDGRLYLDPLVGAEVHEIQQDLRLSPARARVSFPRYPRCEGAGGTATAQSEVVEGMLVESTIDCCGDISPTGVWICPVKE